MGLLTVCPQGGALGCHIRRLWRGERKNLLISYAVGCGRTFVRHWRFLSNSNWGSLARRIRILSPQQIHHLLTAIIQTPQLARRAFRESVSSDQRQRHGGIEVTDDGARQLVGVNLAPANRLARCGA